MAGRERTRRQYLRVCSAASIAGIAGCQWGAREGTDSTGDGQQSEREGPESLDEIDALPEFPTLAGADPTYRRWLPADAESYLPYPILIHLGQFRDARSEMEASTYDQSLSWVTTGDYFGVDPEEMTGVIVSLASPPSVIYPDPVDQTAVESVLTETGYSQTTVRSNTTFFERVTEDVVARVAVGSEGVVQDWGANAESFVEDVEVIYETARGERERRHEASTAFRNYTERVGWPPVVTGLTDGTLRGGRGLGFLPDGAAESVRYGVSVYHVEGTRIERYWLWTRDDATHSPEEIRQLLETRGRANRFTPENTIAIRTEGRVNEMAIIEPVENTGGGEDPPLFTLRASHEAGMLTLRHLAGGPVQRDRLEVYGSGIETDLGSGRLQPGDEVSIQIDIDAGEEIDVVYSSPAGATTQVATAESADGS